MTRNELHALEAKVADLLVVRPEWLRARLMTDAEALVRDIKKETAMTSRDRLSAWADGETRIVELWCQSGHGQPLVAFWHVEAEIRSFSGPNVRVAAGPEADPEKACGLVIERLALVDVIVP